MPLPHSGLPSLRRYGNALSSRFTRQAAEAADHGGTERSTQYHRHLGHEGSWKESRSLDLDEESRHSVGRIGRAVSSFDDDDGGGGGRRGGGGGGGGGGGAAGGEEGEGEGEEDEAAKWDRERAAMEAEEALHEEANQQTKGWRVAASTFRRHVYDSAGYEPPEQKLERTHATLQRTVKLFKRIKTERGVSWSRSSVDLDAFRNRRLPPPGSQPRRCWHTARRALLAERAAAAWLSL